MFAKLKKKIEVEGGAVPSSDSHGRTSGHRDSVGSLPRAGSIQHLGPSPPGSVTSETASIQDVLSSRDEIATLLQKKSEQCKKLEGNISDLAALIKEKNKTIEKLEATLRQQEEITNKKLQEQKDEFERYRDRLIEGYQNDKLQLEKEKTELRDKLSTAEQYKARYFKKEEENDEFEGLKIQELAKVKHLLLNTEEALAGCKSELEARTRQCHAAQVQVEKLTDELGPLRQRLASIESEMLKLSEENSERAELVITLSRDKAAFDKRLDEVNTEMKEKQGYISQLQAQLADLDGEHKTLVRNSDLLRNKNSILLEEKDDHIETLKETLRTLEQRLSDSSLSGDDRLSALKVERDSLEQKLAEARLQLTEVKSTWSDKITHLEDQISHLNTKIVEDNEEYQASQKMTEQMKESFYKQIEDLRGKLDDAEKRALENLDLASSKDSHYEKQIEEMRHVFQQHLQTAEDSEESLKEEIMSLNVQLRDLEEATKRENETAQARIIFLEEQAAAANEDKTKQEQKVEDMEKAMNQLQVVIAERDCEVRELKQQLQDSQLAGHDQNTLITIQKQELQEKQAESEKLKRERDNLERQLQVLEQEKVSLLEQNTDLQKQLQNVKASSSYSVLELQKMVELKSQAVDSLRKTEVALRQRLELLEQTIEQNEISKAESGLYSDRIDEMNNTILSLQSQVTEKSRIVKKQEQMLKDLRVTLQRELKIQSLPNDDGVDLTSNNVSTSPVMTRKFGSDSKLAPRFHEPAELVYPQQKFLDSYNSTQHGSSPVQPSPPTMPAQMTFPSSASVNVSISNAPADVLASHTASMKRELDKDVNFLYLKHVVLKFMLSRESEAIQLIKAVSVLLNFTHQEQQLIKDTLEWRRSWFGHRPPVGKGQTSKVVPPML